MLKIRHLAVAAVLVLCAAAAMANNFRAGDQVYVPIAGNIAASGGRFVSDVWVQNLSNDSVTVSVIVTARAGLDQGATTPDYKNDLFTLAPRERREINNFVGAPTSQGGLGLDNFIGSLVFNACRANASCTDGLDEFGFDADFRDISVFSRIYFYLGANPTAVGTTGQAFPGIPWYNYASSRANTQGLNRLSINGFRQTGTSGGATGTYRGNVGVMNASQFSNTTLLLKLYQGASQTALAERRVTLGPLNVVQGNLTDFFPSVPTASTSVGLYVTVEQESSQAVGGAPTSCGSDGCPGFIAYGTILDNTSGDGTTLEAVFEKPLSGAAINEIYGSSAGKPNYRRIARRSAQ